MFEVNALSKTCVGKGRLYSVVFVLFFKFSKKKVYSFLTKLSLNV